MVPVIDWLIIVHNFMVLEKIRSWVFHLSAQYDTIHLNKKSKSRPRITTASKTVNRSSRIHIPTYISSLKSYQLWRIKKKSAAGVFDIINTSVLAVIGNSLILSWLKLGIPIFWHKLDQNFLHINVAVGSLRWPPPTK